MSDLAIKVEGVGKKYKIGRKRSGDLRETFSQFINKLQPKNSSIRHLNYPTASMTDSTLQTKEFWALKDINFDVKQGEAVGIIGKNGAGKSTLLKILSRITKPTTGRFEINGQVSSLLEVGTGFHMELSGRENIYLNGTILGMKSKEIKSKFDEIVAFSGVEKFIDTPAKHYSSGMKVRLAFSVAAHLEPKILIIDEVLAVGDSTFQKKCIDKMTDVIKQGRTVLFVSHNMQAIRNLCSRTILLSGGEIKGDNLSDIIINEYLNSNEFWNSSFFDLTKIVERRGVNRLIFKEAELNSATIKPGEKFKIGLKLKSCDTNHFKDLLFGVNIKDVYGNNIAHLSNIFLNKINIKHSNDDLTYIFSIESMNFKPGRYHASLFLRANEEVQDWIDNAICFEIIEGNIYNFSNSKMIKGVVQPIFEFTVK